MTEHRTTKSIDAIKYRAKQIKREEGIKHAEALELAAREFGYADYPAVRRALKRGELS